MPVTTALMHPVPVAKGMKAIDKYTSHVTVAEGGA